MKALNHYLFEIVRFDPRFHFCKTSSTDYEYYFERVYFDMGIGEFVSVKKLSALNSVKAGRFF